jgi:flagellar motor switch protein FliG
LDANYMITNPNANLRKAVVFIRSLDSETAATMLGQLTPEEAAKLRDAIRAVGAIDPEEQADVAAEFRSARPIAAESVTAGVELEITSREAGLEATTDNPPSAAPGRPFHFLEDAPIDILVPYLAREHAQTIAVVLSQLPPPRAASILAALPEKVQAETVDRIAALGETDPASVIVVERELAAWLARRTTGRPGNARRNDVVSSILAAADGRARARIIASLRAHKVELANALAPMTAAPDLAPPLRRRKDPVELNKIAAGTTNRSFAGGAHVSLPVDSQVDIRRNRARAVAPDLTPSQGLQFDDLIHLDNRALAAVLREVNLNVLVLALAGSKEELIRRVCGHLPKRSTRLLRRELRRMGPTRLSDVEAAQHAVALVAAKQLNDLSSRGRDFAASPAIRHAATPTASRPQTPVTVA